MTRGVGVHWLGDTGHPITHDDCPEVMRSVQRQHMDTDQLKKGGAADFGYNAGACPHGVVFEGRGPKIRNAANGGRLRQGVDSNAGWASVLYLGSKAGPQLTSQGMDAINDAAEWLGVAGGEWLGHKDFFPTECPGDVIYSWVHNGHPRGSGGPIPKPEPSKRRRRAVYMYWYKDGLFYSDGIHRTPWGLAPQVVDALTKQGVPIVGQPGDTWTEGTHNSLKALV